MPRISTPTVLQAYQHSPLLPLLLSECRSLQSAKNELRWLRERAQRVTRLKSIDARARAKHPASGWRKLLKSMCLARSRGVPLQYILGDQPFGDLEIICRKGVLIPRHETESITVHTARLILDNIPKDTGAGEGEKTSLRILDLCTGTGCISLLLHALLSPHFQRLFIVGVDISEVALRLARANREHNVCLGLLSKRALSEVHFQHGNVLEHGDDPCAMLGGMTRTSPASLSSPELRCDVLISNPPYISPENYRDGTTSRSVRIFEPKLALVPPDTSFTHSEKYRDLQREDVFYHQIVLLLSRVQIKLAVLECGSRSQAERVAAHCKTVLDKCQGISEISVNVWSVGGFDTDPCAVIIQRRQADHDEQCGS